MRVITPLNGGLPYRRRFHLFECPICKEEIESCHKARGIKQKSCGKCAGTQRVTHGHSGKPYYKVWQQMLQRCTNPTNNSYHCYGARGIKVCEEWRTFEGFWKDMADGYQKGLTLDRIDGTGNYEVANCEWISHSANSSKTSRNRTIMVTVMKGTHIVSQDTYPTIVAASKATGVPLKPLNRSLTNHRATRSGYIFEYV